MHLLIKHKGSEPATFTHWGKGQFHSHSNFFFNFSSASYHTEWFHRSIVELVTFLLTVAQQKSKRMSHLKVHTQNT